MAGGLHTFDKSLAKANTWLKELMADLGCGEAAAHQALRAVLHALRDRLPVGENARLAAQLPRLIRGLYFEEWHPGDGPVKIRREDELLAAVRLHADALQVDAADAVAAVLGLIARHVSPGEVEGVLRCLPPTLRTLWPTEVRRRARPYDPARVRDHMSPEVLTVSPDDQVVRAVELMAKEGARHVLVVFEDGPTGAPVREVEILGILSSEDAALLVQQEDGELRPAELRVRDAMTPAPLVTIDPDASIEECAARMRQERVHALPVIAAGRLVGILTSDDVLAALTLELAA